MIKQAVLLAAGMGTRLRPLTNSQPKCLVPIGDKPLLYIWLESLYQSGVRRFVINCHYFSEQVVEAVEQHHLSDLITLVYEDKLKGTAGTVKHILSLDILLPEDTLVLHADNLCQCCWEAFFDFHHNNRSFSNISLMSFVTDEPKRCGILEVGPGQELLDFHEKVDNPPGDVANGAIYIFSPEGMNYFNQLADEETDISLHLLPKVKGDVRVWPTDGYLKDIGTPEAYSQANTDWRLLHSQSD